MNNTLIEIKRLCKSYPIYDGFFNKPTSYNHALNNLNLNVCRGEILAIAGESGCGKTTLGRCILRLEKTDSGEILYNSQNLLTFEKKDLKEFRKKAQIVFQNPYASLNPKMTIFQILKEPLLINKYNKKDILNSVEEYTQLVGLSLNDLKKYPHEFSGGQRQRIAIARALILKPEFLIADEPVSALDVSIQAQIINLLKDLKEKLNFTMIFISHDLSVIRHIADRVAVMYMGEIIEEGLTDEIYNFPCHPYTKILLNSIPSIDFNKKKEKVQPNIILSTSADNHTCHFYSRCRQKNEKCNLSSPQIKNISNTHFVKCSNI